MYFTVVLRLLVLGTVLLTIGFSKFQKTIKFTFDFAEQVDAIGCTRKSQLNAN